MNEINEEQKQKTNPNIIITEEQNISNNNQITINNNNNKENENFIGKIILNKYKIIKKIRRGSQSQIYLGENIKTFEQLAIKVEKNKPDNCLLKNEIYILGNLQNNFKNNNGIVDMFSCATYKGYLILVEKLLGKSLELLFLDLSKKFTLLDICQIALQSIDRIEYVHSKGIIHCDIKPENFVIGIEDPNMLYLIDFGLGQKYISLKTGKHIEFKFTGYMTGTARYASRNALRGKCLSRRDDIESFMYMILYFMAKRLPWQGLKAKNLGEKYKKIYNYKKEFNYQTFCKNYPKEIITLFEYVYSLAFNEKPSYQYIRELFKKILETNNLYIKDIFSWMDKTLYNDIIKQSKRPLSETKEKNNENKKKIKSSIIGNLKESTITVTNLRLSKIKDSLKLNLEESNNEEIINDNDFINEEEENINNEKNNGILSTGTNIQHKLEKYPDDEEEKKFELKKQLDVIKEEENEDDNDLIDLGNKKMGGSVHLYKIDMNEYKFDLDNKKENEVNQIEKGNIDLTKTNINFINEKKQIKTKLIGKNVIDKIDKKENMNKINNENLINNENKIYNGNKINNENIMNIENKEDNININKINNIENEIKEEKNKIIINNEKQNINEIKKEENNLIGENNKIILKEIKSKNSIMTEYDLKYDLEQKIKARKGNIVPKKVVFKKKFKNDGDIKYSSIGSQNYESYKKKGYFSATQRDAKTKIARELDEENANNKKKKNQNCLIF